MKRKMFKDYKPVELSKEEIRKLKRQFPKIKKEGKKMELQNIIRKDGIEYTRKKKDNIYDCNIIVRVSKDMKDRIKQKANEQNINSAEFIRNALEEHLKNN